MISRRAVLAAGAAFAAAPWPLRAQSTLVLEGRAVQGGLIVGRATPGAAVTLDGKSLRVSARGHFAFGFGRDRTDAAQITVTYPGGTREERSLVPEPRSYEIQRIDGLPDAYVTPPQEVLDRIAREARRVAEARDRDTGADWYADGLDWPLSGPVTGVYGSQRILNGEPRQPHYGIDIAAPEGTAIAASADGVVSLAERDLYYTGGTVILDHGAGVSTTYLHMSRLDVELDQPVARGTVIGAVGKTGRATGPHLCWRLNWFQERLDPALSARTPSPARS